MMSGVILAITRIEKRKRKKNSEKKQEKMFFKCKCHAKFISQHVLFGIMKTNQEFQYKILLKM